MNSKPAAKESLFQEFNAKYLKYRLNSCNAIRKWVHALSPSLKIPVEHTIKGVAAGLFTGLLLVLAQFTFNADVNHMAAAIFKEFVAHYQSFPAALLNMVGVVIGASFLASSFLGGFLRSSVAVWIIDGLSHTIAITSGMILCLIFTQISEVKALVPIVVSILLVVISVLINLLSYLFKHGFSAFLKDNKEAFVECKISDGRPHSVADLIAPLLGIFVLLASWNAVTADAAKFKENEKKEQQHAAECKEKH